MDASKLMWRPPYPSENLKTARFAKIAKTYSTTNPYATQEDDDVQLQRNTQRNTQDNNSSGNQSEFQDFQHSKRENNSNKIYERGLTPQVGMNPFLQGNYLQDLETQNEFLKPINSNNGLRTNDLSGSDQDVISKNV
jgi:hypothetical protein